MYLKFLHIVNLFYNGFTTPSLGVSIWEGDHKSPQGQIFQLLMTLGVLTFTILPAIMPNLFFNLLKTLSSIENAKIFTILTSRNFWQLANSISNNFTSPSLPPLLQPDGPTAVSFFSNTPLHIHGFFLRVLTDCTNSRILTIWSLLRPI